MSILYLGGISVGNTMRFRRRRISSTYSRIGQTIPVTTVGLTRRGPTMGGQTRDWFYGLRDCL